MGTSFFTIERLQLRFGGLLAVDDFSCSVAMGEIVGIIGPNGAGKTTVFNCISGLYRADAGSIRFSGHELIGRAPHRIAALGLGRTFQNLELFPHLSAVDNLMLGRHLHTRTGLLRGMCMWGRRSFAAREEVRERAGVDDLLDKLGLADVRMRPVGTLPYGSQKRVELGRALAGDPCLLLLDEPSAGMNDLERADMYACIRDLAVDRGTAILMIEHHMASVMGLADRIIAMDFGRKIADGPPARVRTHPEVVRAYIGG